MRRVFPLGLGLVALTACTEDDGKLRGTEGGPCYPNDTCNAGLLCLSHLCVRLPEAGLPFDAFAKRDAETPDKAVPDRGRPPDRGPIKCTTPFDCPMGYDCKDGTCVPPKACKTDADCPPDYTCKQGSCRAPRPCQTDTDCKKPSPTAPAMVCVKGKCVPLPDGGPADLSIPDGTADQAVQKD